MSIRVRYFLFSFLSVFYTISNYDHVSINLVDFEIKEVLMRQSILFGIIILIGLVAVNGVGITTFLLGEHLHSHKTGPATVADQEKSGLNSKII